MKLADVKKLKVAELRSKLKEVGLDSKGLKTELVDRLWSAVQDGLEEEENTSLHTKQHDSSPISAALTDTAEVRDLAVTDVEVNASCGLREYRDSGTQTESDAAQSAPQHGSECSTKPVRSFQSAEETGGGRGRAFYEFKEEIRYKRAKSPQPPEGRDLSEEWDEDQVHLNPPDSHLHFELSSDGCCGKPRFWNQFPSLWSGCRLSHGVLQGNVGFEVRLERKLLNTQPEEQEDMETYGVRVGWSVVEDSLLLGEDGLSFAYDGRGMKVSGGKEEEFGEVLSEGDIIGCYASFSKDGSVQLSFHKNGRFMGVAFSFSTSLLESHPLFPHVLCKSCSLRILLDPSAPPWYPSPAGFTPIAALPAAQRLQSTLSPSTRAECEVLLMVGFPGSGKTHWARTHIRQHPEKHYRLLGTEDFLCDGQSDGQRDIRLRQASHCLTELIKLAAQTSGNYILDQNNILFSARRHKLQLFSGFRRKVVVVFPSADEWKKRLMLHQTSEGEQIPQTALLKLQVSCTLPEEQSDLTEEVQYVELPQEQAQTLLQEYKDCARRLLPPVPTQKKQPRMYKKRPYPPGPPPPAPLKFSWAGRNGHYVSKPSDLHSKHTPGYCGDKNKN
uniref:Si:ch211-107m4.1 n=1 Tax=Cynoglossus semilaevis TaxID=244447 RepID=A0A3P8V0G6_CYNSE